MLAVGMFAWVARYGLFSMAATDHPVMWMVIGGILLHGICYDFFFVTGFLYVDRTAPKAIRGQAQGFLVLVTQGLGLGIGAKVVEYLVASSKTTILQDDGTLRDAGTNWHGFWMTLSVIALIVLIAFVTLFRERASTQAAQAKPT
jgi:MFS family permease